MTPRPAHEGSNIHATAVVIGTRGVLIAGPSGSGKTMLALELVRRAQAACRFGRLVADDRVWVAANAGRLLCRAPREIAGLAEVRGFRPAPVPHVGAAVIDLLVRLVPAAQAPRMADDAAETIAGCDLPRLDLPERHCIAAALAIEAWLSACGRSQAPG